MKRKLTLLQRTRLAVFFFYIVQGICFSSWASRIPTIKTKLDIGDGKWGTILLMLSIGEVLGMCFSGWVVSKFGSKKILPIALLGNLIAFATLGLADSIITLSASLVGFGFAANFYNIALNTQGVNVEAAYGKSIMATFHGGWSLAGAIASVIGMTMIGMHVNPFSHFMLIIILVVIIYIINYKYLVADKKIEVEVDASGKKEKHKPEKFLYYLGIIAFCGMAAEGAMHDWSAIYYKDIIGAPNALVPLGFAAYMVTMASARFVIDQLTRKIGKQHVLQISGACIFIGLMLAVAVPSIYITTFAFMIIALGTASIAPTAYSAAGKNSKIASSMALMIVSSIGFLGYLIGPPIIGYISHLSNLRYSYALIGLFGLAIIFISSNVRILRENK